MEKTDKFGKFYSSLSDKEKRGFILGKGIESALRDIKGYSERFDIFKNKDPRLHSYFNYFTKLANQLHEEGINIYAYSYLVTKYFHHVYPNRKFYYGMLGTKEARQFYSDYVRHKQIKEQIKNVEEEIIYLDNTINKIERFWKISREEVLTLLEDSGKIDRGVRKRLERNNNN